ncbi:MAG: TrkA family potassium uptake protein [Dermabacter sp.]|nr:TrkA family potassium uptake protein [Dermabacter sp.]
MANSLFRSPRDQRATGESTDPAGPADGLPGIHRPAPAPQLRAEARVRSVLVLGLGRFGSALARELAAMRIDVVGVDASMERVDELASDLTRVVQGDITQPGLLEQLGMNDVDRVVVALSNPLEASIIATTTLLQAGVEHVWAKASSAQHEQILRQLGTHRIVSPNRDTGVRSAHQIVSYADDWMAVGAGYAVLKMPAPDVLVGRNLAEARIHERDGMSVIARYRRGAAAWDKVTHTTVFEAGDHVLLAGRAALLEEFARRG